MTVLPVAKARADFAHTINRVAYAGERIVIGRGKRRVAMVSLDDLALIERIENELDAKGAMRARKEKGRVSWEDTKKKLNL